jgi:hypothetical protein
MNTSMLRANKIQGEGYVVFGVQSKLEIMNSHACVCVLNNILLTCNYDYNINSYFEICNT